MSNSCSPFSECIFLAQTYHPFCLRRGCVSPRKVGASLLLPLFLRLLRQERIIASHSKRIQLRSHRLSPFVQISSIRERNQLRKESFLCQPKTTRPLPGV